MLENHIFLKKDGKIIFGRNQHLNTTSQHKITVKLPIVVQKWWPFLEPSKVGFDWDEVWVQKRCLAASCANQILRLSIWQDVAIAHLG